MPWGAMRYLAGTEICGKRVEYRRSPDALPRHHIVGQPHDARSLKLWPGPVISQVVECWSGARHFG